MCTMNFCVNALYYSAYKHTGSFKWHLLTHLVCSHKLLQGIDSFTAGRYFNILGTKGYMETNVHGFIHSAN